MIANFMSAAEKNNSLLCVGLDSDIAKLPDGVDQVTFNKAIIDATHDLVACYKPNSAFYEAAGDEGIRNLKETCDYITQKHPDIPIILDAKRADIGNTNNGYIEYAFEYLGVDAITLHPYMGGEAIQPFLDRADKGAVILCRTSNPGSAEFQDLEVDGAPLYQAVARRVVNEWNANDNCMLVVGATYPEEIETIRGIVGDDVWFLVPGVGAQGGDVEKTIKAGLSSDGMGMVINSSRGIIFASNGEDYADAAREQAESLRNEINKYR